MHIAEIKVTNQWQKLEDIIKQKVSDFVFENGKKYTIQNIGNSSANFIEKSNIPTDETGFIKQPNESPIVYTKTIGTLYVKSCVINTFLTVLDDD